MRSSLPAGSRSDHLQWPRSLSTLRLCSLPSSDAARGPATADQPTQRDNRVGKRHKHVYDQATAFGVPDQLLELVAHAYVRSTARAGQLGFARACPWRRSGRTSHGHPTASGSCGCHSRGPGTPWAARAAAPAAPACAGSPPAAYVVGVGAGADRTQRDAMRLHHCEALAACLPRSTGLRPACCPPQVAFCKTNWKPYDPVVCAILIRAHRHLPDIFVFNSDGDWEDECWRAARSTRCLPSSGGLAVIGQQLRRDHDATGQVRGGAWSARTSS